MDANRVSVVGAGNGGVAIAAGLTDAGFDVTLAATPAHDSNLRAIRERGAIEATGALEATVEPDQLTTDPADAVADAALVIVTVPATGHDDVAAFILDQLTDGQTLAVMPGYGSSIAYRRRLGDRDVVVGETTMLPYASRLSGPGQVTIQKAATVLGAGYPTADNDRFGDTLERYFPFHRLENALDAAIKNPNPLIHPIPSILNVADIDRRGGDISLYGEGMTDRVSLAMDALDAERRNIEARIGAAETTLDGIYELQDTGPIYRQSMGTDADRFLERFITEDVPLGLRFWLSAGEALDVDMPLTRAVIELASALWEADYMATGRTHEDLGIDRATVRREFGGA